MTHALEPPPSPGSFLSTIDPRAKLVGLVFAAGCVAVLRSMGPALLACFLSSALLVSARLPAGWVWGRMRTILWAICPIAILLPVFQGWEGLELAVLFAAKAIAISALMLVLIGTAPLPATARAARSLGIPSGAVRLTLLSYRFVSVLAEEAGHMQTAMRVRGFRSSLSLHTSRTLGGAIGSLLVRGAARAERVAQALACRGENGQFRVLDERRFGIRDALFVGVMVIVGAGLGIWDWVGVPASAGSVGVPASAG
jgi:cobalt/nickel transport system permease protein